MIWRFGLWGCVVGLVGFALVSLDFDASVVSSICVALGPLGFYFLRVKDQEPGQHAKPNLPNHVLLISYYIQLVCDRLKCISLAIDNYVSASANTNTQSSTQNNTEISIQSITESSLVVFSLLKEMHLSAHMEATEKYFAFDRAGVELGRTFRRSLLAAKVLFDARNTQITTHIDDALLTTLVACDEPRIRHLLDSILTLHASPSLPTAKTVECRLELVNKFTCRASKRPSHALFGSGTYAAVEVRFSIESDCIAPKFSELNTTWSQISTLRSVCEYIVQHHNGSITQLICTPEPLQTTESPTKPTTENNKQKRVFSCFTLRLPLVTTKGADNTKNDTETSQHQNTDTQKAQNTVPAASSASSSSPTSPAKTTPAMSTIVTCVSSSIVNNSLLELIPTTSAKQMVRVASKLVKFGHILAEEYTHEARTIFSACEAISTVLSDPFSHPPTPAPSPSSSSSNTPSPLHQRMNKKAPHGNGGLDFEEGTEGRAVWLVQAAALLGLGEMACYEGDLVFSKECFQRAVRLQRQLFGNSHEIVATTYTFLGSVCRELGEHEEAKWALSKALEIARLANHDSTTTDTLTPTTTTTARSTLAHDTAAALLRLGIVHQDQRKHKEAEAMYREALNLDVQRLGPTHSAVSGALDLLVQVLAAQGKTSEAQKFLIRRFAVEDSVDTTLDGLTSLATILYQQKHYDLALTTLDHSIEWYQGLYTRNFRASHDGLRRSQTNPPQPSELDQLAALLPARCWRARCLHRLNRTQEALDELNKIKRDIPAIEGATKEDVALVDECKDEMEREWRKDGQEDSTDAQKQPKSAAMPLSEPTSAVMKKVSVSVSRSVVNRTVP